MSEERCVMCGDIIPEGRQICPWCACGIKGDDSPSRTADMVMEKGETKTMDFYMMIRALDEKSRKIGLTEKERLEKLIYEGLYAMQGAVVIGLNGGHGFLADYLMSEGVIVSPCKPGDVVHGEWKMGKSGCMYFCSKCELWAFPREVHEWNFCPNCGAKMDGKDNVKRMTEGV